MWSLCVAVLAVPCEARATLGADETSVQNDRIHLKGQLRILLAASHSVHEIHIPGGTLVREYVTQGGTVFGVTWRGPFRPDLRLLLGSHFDRFQQAAQAIKRQRPGHGPLAISTPDLVVHMAGTARAFFGRAYLPELIPSNTSAADIQ